MGIFSNWREHAQADAVSSPDGDGDAVQVPGSVTEDDGFAELHQETNARRTPLSGDGSGRGEVPPPPPPEAATTDAAGVKTSVVQQNSPASPVSFSAEDGQFVSRQSSLADPLIGMLIDQRYLVEQLLARGGMASVYIAHDERLDRPVAVKVMHPHLAQSADFVHRFRREARAAARISHPCVVSVFDQGVVSGCGYLVMELVSGQNLRHYLNAEGALSVKEALDFTESILQALSQAHRQGVIHRDIKPENILVPPEGQIKVTDFGLARAASDVSAATTGSVLGTVAYLAPELVNNAVPDARSDLYAVGIMLYEMLTSHTPFEDRTALQVALAHVNEDVPAPSALESWIPPEVDEFVCSLACRDPRSRPVDAAAALGELVQLRAQLPESVLAMRASVERPEVQHAPTMPVAVQSRTVALPISQLERGPVQTVAVSNPKRRGFLVISTVAVLLIACAAAFTWWWLQYGPGAYVKVPQLAGQTQQEATNTLSALDLAIVVNEDFSDDVAAGKVISTEPEGGGQVHKDGTVTLLVSKGVKMVEIPNLTGVSEADLKGKLHAAELQLGKVTKEYSETITEGMVISWDPSGSDRVAHDTAVNVVVSKGREPLKVPDVTGKSAEDATAVLTEAGFTVSTSEAFSDDVDKGLVISQDPTSEQTRYRGDSINVVVSRGPEMVAMPNVVRMSEEEAIATLERAGLVVKVTRVYAIFGSVATTDPPAGTMVRVGSTVEIRTV